MNDVVGSRDIEIAVGAVGVGWAGEQHLRAYAQLPNARLVALAALESDRVEALSDELGIAHRLSHWEELLELDEIDAVSVCTPNYLHAPVTIAALQRGKHVLCEKPLAMSLAEGEAMVEAAEANDRVLDVAFNFRERGDTSVLHDAAATGRFGDLYHAKANWSRRSGIPSAGWITTRDLSGGGPLIDLGVHVLDLALHVLGEPLASTVSAVAHTAFGNGSARASDGREFDVEDSATALIRFGDGKTLLLEAAWASHADLTDEITVELFGTDAGARLHIKDYATRDTLRFYQERDGVPTIERPVVSLHEGHLGVVRRFLAAIESDSWADRHGRVPLERARILDACYESVRRGAEVAIEREPVA